MLADQLILTSSPGRYRDRSDSKARVHVRIENCAAWNGARAGPSSSIHWESWIRTQYQSPSRIAGEAERGRMPNARARVLPDKEMSSNWFPLQFVRVTPSSQTTRMS